MGKHAKEEVNIAELRHELQSEKNISAKRMKRIVELERTIINADASYVKAQGTLKLHLDKINELEHEVWAARQESAARELLLLNAQGQPTRIRLPETRKSITRKFKIPRPNHPEGDFKFYATVGLYDNGMPGEIFLRADRAGSFANGTLDAVALALSVAWQHGVPFIPLVEKLKDLRFEPEGMTGDKEFPIVTSPLDYVARWLLARFTGAHQAAKDASVPMDFPGPGERARRADTQEDAQFRVKLARGETIPGVQTAVPVPPMRDNFQNLKCKGCGMEPCSGLTNGFCRLCHKENMQMREERERQDRIYTGPPCNLCGSLTRRAGACYVCDKDGTTTGCG